MKFSVIIPLYNKESYLSQTLNSVKGQTYKDFEVIIVDDGSLDRSLSIANSYKTDSRFKVYHLQNGGVSKARNYGISVCKGDYICFLDADDVWNKNYLSEAAYLLHKYGDINMICFSYNNFSEQIDNISKQCNLRSYFADEDKLIDYFCYSVKEKRSIALTSGVVVKKSCVSENSIIFAHDISMGEDIDFWVRIAAYAPIVYSNKCLMYYRIDSEENLSSKGLKSLSLSFPYWRWYDLKSFSPYKDKFTTRMIYSLAMMGRYTGESLMIRQVLSKIVGSYLIFSRICLYICSFNMSFFLIIDSIKKIKRYYLSN